MSFLSMLNNTCDIYHMIREDKSVGFGLPSSPSFIYPVDPDEAAVICHFGIKNGTVTIVPGEPKRKYEARLKLSLPFGTDVRVNDKIVDCETGLEYTAGIPRNIRRHHVIVWLYRTSEQAPL